jgi:hemerythrin superfamily protein
LIFVTVGIRHVLTVESEAFMSTDAIVILKNDHKTIKKLFKEFQSAGEDATQAKGRIVGRIIEELTVHPDLEDDVLESYEEHHVADVLSAELSAMKPDDERFDAKTTVLIENVTHHIDEEERDWFPQVRQGLGRKQLQELGARMTEMREKAPRSPAQPSALKKAVDAVTG